MPEAAPLVGLAVSGTEGDAGAGDAPRWPLPCVAAEPDWSTLAERGSALDGGLGLGLGLGRALMIGTAFGESAVGAGRGRTRTVGFSGSSGPTIVGSGAGLGRDRRSKSSTRPLCAASGPPATARQSQPSAAASRRRVLAVEGKVAPSIVRSYTRDTLAPELPRSNRAVPDPLVRSTRRAMTGMASQ